MRNQRLWLDKVFKKNYMLLETKQIIWGLGSTNNYSRSEYQNIKVKQIKSRNKTILLLQNNFLSVFVSFDEEMLPIFLYV